MPATKIPEPRTSLKSSNWAAISVKVCAAVYFTLIYPTLLSFEAFPQGCEFAVPELCMVVSIFSVQEWSFQLCIAFPLFFYQWPTMLLHKENFASYTDIKTYQPGNRSQNEDIAYIRFRLLAVTSFSVVITYTHTGVPSLHNKRAQKDNWISWSCSAWFWFFITRSFWNGKFYPDVLAFHKER